MKSYHHATNHVSCAQRGTSSKICPNVLVQQTIAVRHPRNWPGSKPCFMYFVSKALHAAVTDFLHPSSILSQWLTRVITSSQPPWIIADDSDSSCQNSWDCDSPAQFASWTWPALWFYKNTRFLLSTYPREPNAIDDHSLSTNLMNNAVLLDQPCICNSIPNSCSYLTTEDSTLQVYWNPNSMKDEQSHVSRILSIHRCNMNDLFCGS